MKNKMSWGEIIVGIIFLLAGVEETFGKVILENSVGNPFYAGIWIGVKLFLILGPIGLIDGIARQFNSNLWKLLVGIKGELEKL